MRTAAVVELAVGEDAEQRRLSGVDVADDGDADFHCQQTQRYRYPSTVANFRRMYLERRRQMLEIDLQLKKYEKSARKRVKESTCCRETNNEQMK